MVYQMSGNTQYTTGSKIQMSESIITDLYIGKYVVVQLVDETVELTVENNVYSLTESVELEQDILKALHVLRTQYKLPEISKC
jgi:hypothetical protein